MSTTRSTSPKAPVTNSANASTALLLCGHGSTADSGILNKHSAAIASLDLFEHVSYCYLYGEPSLDEALAALPVENICIVPFLMAEGATFGALMSRLVKLTQGRATTLCRPIGTHPRMTELIEARAKATCREWDWPTEETTLLLVGHGTRRHKGSAAALRGHADALGKRGQFAEVATAFLSQNPEIRETLAKRNPRYCVAIGFFADSGQHGAHDVPSLLAATKGEIRYGGPIGTSEQLQQMIVAQALASAGQQVAAI